MVCIHGDIIKITITYNKIVFSFIFIQYTVISLVCHERDAGRKREYVSSMTAPLYLIAQCVCIYFTSCKQSGKLWKKSPGNSLGKYELHRKEIQKHSLLD